MAQNLHSSRLSDYTDDSVKLTNLAKSSLDKFEEISSVSSKKLKSHPLNTTGNVFASPGDARMGSSSLDALLTTTREENKKLKQEPAIAKIVIQNVASGEIEVFYVCRCAPPAGVKDVLSYRSPMGRLVALEVGKRYDKGEKTGIQKYDETDIVKVQDARFIPVRKGGRWDSDKTEYRDAGAKNVITIDSLLRVLDSRVGEDEDILTQLLAEDSRKENITQGIRREIVETFSLRDQPILDKCQDEIFRLPLQYSLLLLGPAGSGKTTTLIRRLGQKLDVEQGLSDVEKHLVDNLSEAGSPHKTSWLMFTPTELLKKYLQEAFNCEGIPAPDRNITTWNAYNHSLGRDIFRILHTSNFKSGFQHDENCETLIDGAANSINIYNDFSTWIVSDYIKGILSALESRKDVERLKDNSVLAAIHDYANKLLNDGKSISSFLRNY
jgi:hypothetical protein